MRETKIKTSLSSLTLQPGNKSLVRSIRENKNSKQNGWAGFNNNLAFDDCRHEYQALSVY